MSKSFGAHLVLAVALVSMGAWHQLFSRSGASQRADSVEVMVSEVHVHHSSKKTTPAAMTRQMETVLDAREEESSLGRDEASDATATKSAETAVASGGPRLGDVYLSELSQLIARHRYYPRSAILNSQQGTVTLKLVISSSGQLNDSWVIQSSGHVILDQAALSTLRRIPAYPVPQGSTDGVTIVVPIHYEIDPEHS